MSINWKQEENIIYSENIVKYNIQKVKVAGFDLDHTLIKPKGKRVHPKDIDDFEYVFPNIIDKLTEIHNNGFSIVIFSNQDDLNNKPEKKKIILGRMEKLNKEVFDKNNIPVQYFIATGRDYCRKPNTGMMDFFLQQHEIKLHKTSFYVGDAAGRTKTALSKKDFSCSDRMFALNCKMIFYTPEQFFDEDDHRAFILDNTAESLFMKEDKDGSLSKAYINWSEIKKFNVVMIMGPPGAGKSFLSNKMIKEYGFTDIISLDVYRTKNKCLREFKNLLGQENKKIIIDNTHSRKSSRKDYLDLIKDKKILLIKINIDKRQSMFLNNFRCKVEKNSRLSDIVIHSYFKYYEEPQLSEGFENVMEIPFIPDFKGKPRERKLFYQYF